MLEGVKRQLLPVMRAVPAVLAAIAGCAPAHADRAADGEAVLRRYCVRCHSGPAARGDFDFVANTPKLIAKGFVVPGDGSHSVVLERVEAGEMPPPGVKQRPSAKEIAALRAWIEGMAAPGVAFRRDDVVSDALAADLAALPVDARPYARWLTLVHLANAGASGAVLERYRVAVAELLGSLTWSAAPPAVVAVDAERTIFRIDLRELGWPAATWDAIRASYPYGVARGPRVPEALRADWFVATASRAPLYYAILGLPATEAELGHRLGIDLAADVAADRVARAGFNSSGVSVNNRVIERHATRSGALWRSYDFKSSVGRENVFAHPLDFVPAGGELIWNLPDGLQAYMLVDAAGRRIDKAVTTIVSDPRRPDRAVATAVSCMGCHASGIIDRADQLREATRELASAGRDRIARLHPPARELTALYAQDRDRFLAALAAVTPPRALTPGPRADAELTDEPITLLVARYEAELGLPLAAAELGLPSSELVARLPRSPPVRQILGALTSGGTVPRDSWEAAFPRIVTELGIGVPVARPMSPGDGAYATGAPPVWQVWIDREHHAWVLEAPAGQRAAAARCRARSLALPRPDELVAAVAQGLAAGLAIDLPMWTDGVALDVSNQRSALIVDPIAGTPRRADLADRHIVVCVQR
jgi:mono/diheme cytochrome c family protein